MKYVFIVYRVDAVHYYTSDSWFYNRKMRLDLWWTTSRNVTTAFKRYARMHLLGNHSTVGVYVDDTGDGFEICDRKTDEPYFYAQLVETTENSL